MVDLIKRELCKLFCNRMLYSTPLFNDAWKRQIKKKKKPPIARQTPDDPTVRSIAQHKLIWHSANHHRHSVQVQSKMQQIVIHLFEQDSIYFCFSKFCDGLNGTAVCHLFVYLYYVWITCVELTHVCSFFLFLFPTRFFFHLIFGNVAVAKMLNFDWFPKTWSSMRSICLVCWCHERHFEELNFKSISIDDTLVYNYNLFNNKFESRVNTSWNKLRNIFHNYGLFSYANHIQNSIRVILIGYWLKLSPAWFGLKSCFKNIIVIKRVQLC